MELDVGSHHSCVLSARLANRSIHHKEHLARFESAVQSLPEGKQHVLRKVVEHPIGAWLSVLPCINNDFALSLVSFVMALP